MTRVPLAQNLRTTFNKIVKRAGLKPWPKPFQNLRSTRETKLMEISPAHVVVAWIGHSEEVAQRHYLQTTDAQFEKAIQPSNAESVAHMTRASTQNMDTAKAKSPENTNVFRDSADLFADLRGDQLPRRDSKEWRYCRGNRTF